MKHNAHISSPNSRIFVLGLFHIQLRPRVSRLTAQGACNVSEKLGRQMGMGKGKDWNVKACYTNNKANMMRIQM